MGCLIQRTEGVLKKDFRQQYEAIAAERESEGYPCFMVMGPRRQVSSFVPAKLPTHPDFQLSDDAIYQFRPGSDYQVARYRKPFQGDFYDIHTPSLTDRALVLAPDCLDMERFATVGGALMVPATYYDSLILTLRHRVTLETMNTLALFNGLTQHLPSQHGRNIAILYVHDMEGVDPDESERLFQANLESLSNILPVRESFRVGAAEASDPEWNRLNAYLAEIGSAVARERYATIERQCYAYLQPAGVYYAEETELLHQQLTARRDYDEVQKQARHLQRVYREQKFQKFAQRGHQDLSNATRKILKDAFKLISENGLNIFTQAMRHIENAKTAVDFDRAIIQAVSTINKGAATAVSAAFSCQNFNGIQIHSEVVKMMSTDLRAIGLSGLPDLIASPLDGEIGDGIEGLKFDPALPSLSERGFRHFITVSILGGSAFATIKGMIAVGWVKGSLAGMVLGPPGVPLGALIGAVIGALMGITISILMIEAQKLRARKSEYERRVERAVQTLAVQSDLIFSDFVTAWSRVLEDDVLAVISAADVHIEQELIKLKSVSSLSQEEIAEKLEEYQTREKEVSAIMEALEAKFKDSETDTDADANNTVPDADEVSTILEALEAEFQDSDTDAETGTDK